VPPDYPEQIAGHILLALGVRQPVVRRLLSRKLPEIALDPGSMITRFSAA